jgi:hypothetical protein
VRLIAQEAQLDWDGAGLHSGATVPDHLLEVVARWTRLVRDSPQVDSRSGVSARFAVAAVETVAASAVRRAAVTGEGQAVARVCDLPSVVAAARGKVEFEAAEEGRELEVLAHLLRRATADTFRARLAGVDLSGLQARFDEGATVESGDLVPAAELLGRLGPVPGLARSCPGSASRRSRRAWPPPRSSWRWRAAPQPPAGQGRGRRPHRLRRLTWSPTCTRPRRTRRTCDGASCSPRWSRWRPSSSWATW